MKNWRAGKWLKIIYDYTLAENYYDCGWMKMKLHQNVGQSYSFQRYWTIFAGYQPQWTQLYHSFILDEERWRNCENVWKLEASSLPNMKITSFKMMSDKWNCRRTTETPEIRVLVFWSAKRTIKCGDLAKKHSPWI